MTRKDSIWRVALVAGLFGLTSDGAIGEEMQSAHERFVEALGAGDAQAMKEMIAEDGFIVFSLGDYRSEVSLPEWLPGFEGMIQSGTSLTVHERDLRSGSGADVGWAFSVQEMSWTREGESEPSMTASWNTTEAWELRDGAWKLVHIHHSSAPEPEGDEEAAND